MDSAEQQIVDSITSTSNILVTVSNNPSVDELSAALGLTLILDKLDKRATAIFSGAIPPAITFLEPEKTFEGTADSLRDFIIALNKEKADHLRYKVDGDVVKIFITPYKTTLTQADLEFSQGDYNVEMVLALGVNDQDHLDNALDAHGKILHDAKVMTITAGANKSNLGSADWHDDKASSLSEMIVSLVNALKSSEPLFDQQTSTALLTGIVSATDRFSNDKTSSQVMTLAAQLMAAGANQQLIAAKLQEGQGLSPISTSSSPSLDAEMSSDGTELTIERDETPAQAPTSGEKVIEPPVAEAPQPPVSNEEVAQLELEKQLAGLTAAPTGTVADIEQGLKDAASTDVAIPAVEPAVDDSLAAVPADTAMPDFEAAALPAVTPEVQPETTAPEETPAPVDAVAGHSAPVGIVSPDQMPMNGTMAGDQEEATIDPFSDAGGISPAQQGATVMPEPAAAAQDGGLTPVAPIEPLAPIAADPAVVATSPADPAVPPAAEPTQPQMPEIPELPPLPPLPPLPADGSVPPLPPPPPPPAFSSTTPMSGAVSGDVFGDSTPSQPATPPAAPSPGQFKIPGQP